MDLVGGGQQQQQQQRNKRVSLVRPFYEQNRNFTLRAKISVLSEISHLLDGLNQHSSLQSWIKNNECRFTFQPVSRENDIAPKKHSC